MTTKWREVLAQWSYPYLPTSSLLGDFESRYLQREKEILSILGDIRVRVVLASGGFRIPVFFRILLKVWMVTRHRKGVNPP